MQITPHFRSKEFNCKDGTHVPNQYMPNVKALAQQLEVLRAALGNKPIIITSGYRTPAHNKKVGGADNSQHLTASAADIVVKGVPPEQIAATLQQLITAGKIKEGGVGLYDNFVHYDIRGTAARWDNRKKKVNTLPANTPNSEGNEDLQSEQLTPVDNGKSQYFSYLIAAGVIVLLAGGYYLYKHKGKK